MIPSETNYIHQTGKYSCTLCDKAFTDESHLERHNESAIHLNRSANNMILKMHEYMIKQEENMKKSQEELKKELLDKMDKTIIGKTTREPNNFNLMHNENHINISNFHETKDNLTNDEKYYLIQRNMMALPYLIKEVHFNPDDPENHNVYISNDKTKTAQVKENGRWVRRDGREVVKDLIDDHHYKFFDTFASDPDIIQNYPKITKYYETYFEITESKEAQKKIQNNIMEIMYNNREMVIATRKREEAQRQRKLLTEDQEEE